MIAIFWMYQRAAKMIDQVGLDTRHRVYHFILPLRGRSQLWNKRQTPGSAVIREMHVDIHALLCLMILSWCYSTWRLPCRMHLIPSHAALKSSNDGLQRWTLERWCCLYFHDAKNMFINIDFKEKLQRYLFCIVMLKSLYSTFPKQLRKNCSTPLFISFQVSWSVRKCRFDVVLATTTRCLWRPLVLQATWQNTFLFMWCFLMLMFAGILGRGFVWTSFVLDGLKQPTTCRSVLQNKGQIWICLNVILYAFCICGFG